MNGKILRFLKRIVSYFWSTGPKKVVRFRELKCLANDSFLNVAENLTGILKQEHGSFQIFKPFNNYFNAFFEEKMVNHAVRYKDGGIFSGAPRILYSLEQGAVFGALGIIYLPETREAIFESAKEWFTPLNENPLFYAARFKPLRKIKGTALSLATVGADGGFYHFLHESFPKLDFCKEQLAAIDYFLVSGGRMEWKVKFLEAAKIDISKIIWLENESHYHFDQLLFTSRLMKDQQFSKENIAGIRGLLDGDTLAGHSGGNEIIWVSRGQGDHRHLRWEELILQKYPQLKFVQFESLSVLETMEICKSCKCFIGPHGAGFSNLVFCQEGTLVLELFSEPMYHPLYNRLSQVCRLEHFAMSLDFHNAEADLGLAYFINSFDRFLLDNPQLQSCQNN